MNMNNEINYCPCCGTNLRAVSIALGFAANPAPAGTDVKSILPVRRKSTPQASRPKNAHGRTGINQWLQDQIVLLAEKGTMSRADIAKKIGVAKSTVVRTLQKLRPDLVHKGGGRPKGSPRVSEEERAKVLGLRKTGKGPTAIADELHMPVKRVHGIIYDKSSKQS